MDDLTVPCCRTSYICCGDTSIIEDEECVQNSKNVQKLEGIEFVWNLVLFDTHVEPRNLVCGPFL